MAQLCILFTEASNPGGTPQQQQPFLLRVRRALDHPEYPWQLRYLGQPELGRLSCDLIICFKSIS
jgi:hypothetical protein